MKPESHESGIATRKRRRLPPPAEPPAALVRLLQVDPEVRQYFGALQAHLDADVQKWKDRAIALKRENQTLKAAKASSSKDKNNDAVTKNSRSRGKTNSNVSKQPPSKINSKVMANSSDSSSIYEDGADLNHKAILPATELVPFDVGVPIEDSMFDDMDSYDGETFDSHKDQSTRKTDPNVDNLSIPPQNDVSEILSFLKEAYDIFQRLGFALVTVRNSDSSSHVKESVDFVGNKTSTPSVEQVSLVEIIDTKLVMTDILRKISTNQLIISSPFPNTSSDMDHDATLSDYFVHVMDESCEKNVDHPILQGKRLLFRAFVLIDTFCSHSIPQKEWDQLFVRSPVIDDEMELECMRVGLRSRKQLVDCLIFFLNDAVGERWVSTDRAQRLLNTRVHFEEKSDVEMEFISADLDVEKKSLFHANLLERSTFCQLASFLLLLRNDSTQSLRNILRYILSAAPLVHDEKVPKLPPLLSLVAIESLLLISDPVLLSQLPFDCTVDATSGKSSTWFHNHVMVLYPQEEDRIRFYEILALVIHASAAIWEKRLASMKDQIHDVASIEMFSYRRLKSMENEWLSRCPFTLNDNIADMLDQFCEESRSISDAWLKYDGCWHEISVIPSFFDQEFRCLPLAVAWIIGGVNVSSLCHVVRDKVSSNDTAFWASPGHVSRLCDFLAILVNVQRELDLRQCEFPANHNAASLASLNVIGGDFANIWQCIRVLSISLVANNQLQLLCTALQCSWILADGDSLLSVTCVLFEVLGKYSSNHSTWLEIPDQMKKFVFDLIRQLSFCPVVRVINLERRKDRMQSFTQVAMRERLVVLKAVVDLKMDSPECDGLEFGQHAVDGSGRLVEATERLVLYTGSLGQLNKLVTSHWRPNDLKPFDVDAPDSEILVRISPSETACALSHIASWKGVLRSLRLTVSKQDLSFCDSVSGLLRSPHRIMRLFKISGFAHGPALLPQNKRMPPSPVCVILEDDAILEERFRERLEAVLQQLPRDFHFCTLGYGRPKSAPIVPFSEHIGIPSMLWYLTGYCLSEAGAQYLLDALPVVGPVDSWIGLKMTNNWDNSFGVKLGVGIHAKPKPSDFPSTDDLSRILSFRAFCAMPPLCSQKVRLSTTATTGGAVVAPTRSGRHWRQRDTDIEYSGVISKKVLDDDVVSRRR